MGYDFEHRLSAATFIIAASDSMHSERADYVCPGSGDQDMIQDAIDAVELGGGANPQHHGKSGADILLLPGKYYFNDILLIERNIFLMGSGFTATEINLEDNSDCGMIRFTNYQGGSDVTYGAGISHMRLDGNITNQTGNWWDLYGLYLNVSDAYFDHIWIDYCGVGLRSGGMWSTYFNQISIEQCTQAAYFNADSSNRFNYLQFVGMNVYQKFEIRAVAASTYAKDITFRDSNLGIGTHAYDSLSIEGNVYDSTIENCKFKGESDTGYYDIKMIDSAIGDPTAITIDNCRFTGVGGAGHIYLSTGSDKNTISRNRFAHATPVNLQTGAANTNGKVCGNYGYVTESSGTATLLSANTSIAVTHGLAVTPVAGDIVVVPMEAWGNMTKFWIDTYTATQFTIHADIAPGANTGFAWKAIVL